MATGGTRRSADTLGDGGGGIAGERSRVSEGPVVNSVPPLFCDLFVRISQGHRKLCGMTNPVTSHRRVRISSLIWLSSLFTDAVSATTNPLISRQPFAHHASAHFTTTLRTDSGGQPLQCTGPRCSKDLQVTESSGHRNGAPMEPTQIQYSPGTGYADQSSQDNDIVRANAQKPEGECCQDHTRFEPGLGFTDLKLIGSQQTKLPPAHDHHQS